ncbi:MAG TPA: helix-turn-helix transcriptional regulator [Thermodesulfobacteriota bacterium]|nr:helix-turn-helix transcriptional regulator [Thermodesulfobacteriota bacterium]
MDTISAIDRIIAANLKRLRERSGLKQSELAQMIETPDTRICAYEEGGECVDKETIIKICQSLGVRFFEFFVEPDTPIVAESDEKCFLENYRKAKEMGIAVQVCQYLEFLIETKAELRRDSSRLGT